jgi:quercetin dioxygenase-like cupin family protein
VSATLSACERNEAEGDESMFVYAKETTAEDLGGGVRRKVLAHDGGLMQVEVAFEEGAVGPLHSHPHEQLTYVLSGEFEFTIGDETKIVRAGDTMYKKSGVLHGCRCLKSGVLLDTFTPQRADYLPK